MPDTLLATAQRLRILAKAYDVSLCDVEGTGTKRVLDLLDLILYAKHLFHSVFEKVMIVSNGCLNFSVLQHPGRLCVNRFERG